MIKQEIKQKATYWQTHKIIFADQEYNYKVITNPKQSKGKNIIQKYGSLENYYKNI